MVNDADNHTVYYPGFMVCHWKNKIAVGSKDTWDEAEFQVWARHGVVSIKVTETVQYDKMIRLLTQVYDSGVFAAKKAIREVLGVRE